MSKTPLLLSAIVVLAVFGSCMSDDDSTDTSSTAASTPSTTATAAPVTRAAPPSTVPGAGTVASTPVHAGEQVTVTEVIDGDTFTISDGRTIRVLGIDSCELGTVQGDSAKLSAEGDLTYSPITLTTEPGVDTDQYGRHLRYVQAGYGNEDFGLEMVQWDHTGVYQGHNDASPAYIQQLYAKDLTYAMSPPSGRECGGSSAPVSSGSDVDVYVDTDDDDVNMPDGALTGGYCARKWWC